MIGLRRSGTRVRSGVVTLVHLSAPVGSTAPSTVPPRVAFAVGRRVGGAVERNRVRRRLRAALRELAAEPGRIPGGAYLVSVGPKAVGATFTQLKQDLARSMAKLTAGDGTGGQVVA